MGAEVYGYAQAASREPLMVVSAVDGHRLWAPVYDSAPNPLLALESRTVIRSLSNTVPARVVDVACGTGRWMLRFREAGATVLGVDTSPEMLAQATSHKELRGRVIQGDAQNLPLPNEMADLIVCSFASAYIRDVSRLMGELARIAVRGGRVIVSEMHCLAASAGWRRSFKRGTSLYELEHFDHSPERVREAGKAHSLHLDTEWDAYFDEDERLIFERAGKQQLYFQLRTVPAVWIAIWTKP